MEIQLAEGDYNSILPVVVRDLIIKKEVEIPLYGCLGGTIIKKEVMIPLTGLMPPHFWIPTSHVMVLLR